MGRRAPSTGQPDQALLPATRGPHRCRGAGLACPSWTRPCSAWAASSRWPIPHSLGWWHPAGGAPQPAWRRAPAPAAPKSKRHLPARPAPARSGSRWWSVAVQQALRFHAAGPTAAHGAQALGGLGLDVDLDVASPSASAMRFAWWGYAPPGAAPGPPRCCRHCRSQPAAHARARLGPAAPARSAPRKRASRCREMRADVTQRRRAQQRVGDGVQQHVGVEWPSRPQPWGW